MRVHHFLTIRDSLARPVHLGSTLCTRGFAQREKIRRGDQELTLRYDFILLNKIFELEEFLKSHTSTHTGVIDIGLFFTRNFLSYINTPFPLLRVFR